MAEKYFFFFALYSSLSLPLHLFSHEGQFGYDIKQSPRKYVFEN